MRKTLPHSTVQRLQFSEEVLNILQNDLAVIITSDEAHFHLNGDVNKQNCRYWEQVTPRELHQKPLHSQKNQLVKKLKKSGFINIYIYFLKMSVHGQTVISEFTAICGYASELFYFLLGEKLMVYALCHTT